MKRTIGLIMLLVGWSTSWAAIISVDKVDTVRGELIVDREGEYYTPLIVMLDGKRIATYDDDHISISAAYPDEHAAELVLVRYSGGNACDGFLRVVDLRGDGPARISEEFGNCNALVGEVKHNKLTVGENPVFRDGAWHMAFYSVAAPETEATWYVYRDGHVHEQGKEVSQIPQDPEERRFAQKLAHEVPDTMQRQQLVEQYGGYKAAYIAWLQQHVNEKVQSHQYSK